MASMIMSRRDLEFMLYEWLQVEGMCQRERFTDHSRETFDAVLELSERLATEQFYPINRILDEQEPRFDGEHVITPNELKPAVRAYCDTGLIGAGFDNELGGMQLPSVIQRASGAWISAASAGGALFGLTPANASTLVKHGTEFHQRVYVPAMLDGRYFGTMCLSEPQAGSSLSDITTRAEPQADGTYRLFGNKMWISGGDEDVSENIIHLVLAKVPGPDGKMIPGTRGISLFAVPKIIVNDDGSHGPRNDVVVAGLNHKLGYRGIPNCLMNFGEGKYLVDGQPGAVGTLVGTVHRGLACMFHMMNDARIMIGTGASAFAYSGYLHALDYARTRVQGRRPQNKDPQAKPVRIIEHADVRRMLLAQKAYAEGGLALSLYCANLVDIQSSPGNQTEFEQASLLLELLTPICKSWPSQWGLEGNSLAIQVHGGYGYTRDFQVEQLWRDQRLNAIHEGTHGIQGLDLLGRKIRLAKGQAWQLLIGKIEQTVQLARQSDTGLVSLADQLERTLKQTQNTIAVLYGADDLDLTLANSTAFLEAFGHLVIAWIWLDKACQAQLKIDGAQGDEHDFYAGKIQAARWFYRWELPKTGPMLDALDTLDRTSLDMADAWF